jgi:hypothetical protein
MKYRLGASAEGGVQAMAVIGWTRAGARGDSHGWRFASPGAPSLRAA